MHTAVLAVHRGKRKIDVSSVYCLVSNGINGTPDSPLKRI